MKNPTLHLGVLGSLALGVWIILGQQNPTPSSPGRPGSEISLSARAPQSTPPIIPGSKPEPPTGNKIPALEKLREQIRFTSSDPLNIGTTIHQVSDDRFIANLRKSPKGTKANITLNQLQLQGKIIANNRTSQDGQWFFAAKLDNMQNAVLTLAKNPAGDVRGAIENPSGSVAYLLDADTNAENLTVKRVNINDILCGTAPTLGIEGTHAIPVAQEASRYEGPDITLAEEADATPSAHLQSSPGSLRVLYLDFDGEYVANTSWNATKNNGNPLTLSPSRFDNRSSDKKRIFRHIAEDFKPFDINVTTDRSVYDAAPDSRKMMVIFTDDSSWYGSAGGVAYLRSFGSGNYCCFVFTDRLQYASSTAIAASHEAGHTLGLSHDGTSDEGYYQGHGSGSKSWGPIMGAPYYKRLVVWDNGTYEDANNSENDYDLINGYLPFRKDDASGTTPLAFSSPDTISAVRTINVKTGNAPENRDVFAFSTRGGTAAISAQPTSSVDGSTYGVNLDLILTILDDDGKKIVQDRGPDSTSASLQTYLPPGNYTLTVETTDVPGPTGYPRYGQSGTYRLTGTIPEAAGIAADYAELVISTYGQNETRTINLTSDRPEPVDYSITTDSPWLTVSPPSGTVTSSSTPITVSTNVASLSPGNYTALINILNQDTGVTLPIPVTLNLGVLTQPQNLVLDDLGPANAYPSSLIVSGYSGRLTEASVRLNGFSHSYPADVRALLVSPSGQKIQLMNTTGSYRGVTDIDLTFSADGDPFPSFLAYSGAGTYRPETKPASTDMEAPAPPRPYSSDMTTLQSQSPNGEWKLYLYDNARGDSGSLESWTLLLKTEQATLETTSYAVGSGTTNTINFNGTPGQTYLLEASSDLSKWNTIQTLTPGSTNASVTFTPPPGPSQFFRIRQAD